MQGSACTRAYPAPALNVCRIREWRVERGESGTEEIYARSTVSGTSRPRAVMRGAEKNLNYDFTSSVVSLESLVTGSGLAVFFPWSTWSTWCCCWSVVGDLTPRKKERKKRDNAREGWEGGTPPPHRDFKERGVVR